MKALGLALLVITLPAAVDAATGPLTVAVHVHTSMSTGDRSLDELVEEARARRIDALVLTDNLLLRFEYGLFPFRGVLKKTVELPSIARTGTAEYLRAIERVQARAPDVVLVPGVEVVPYYYWTGSLVTRDLTMWGAQRNLLVVGLSRAEDYDAIPAIGHGPGSRWSAATVGGLGLAAGVVAGGVGLLRVRREQAVRLRHFRLRRERRYRLPGWALVAIGGLLTLEALAARDLDPYRGDLGIAPHQAVIDAVEARGGLTFWSFPEARDFSQEWVGPVGPVTVRTDPHPEVIAQSDRYTGFGAVYADTVSVTQPGRQWDRLLRDYSEGRRTRPAWGFGELGYHGPPKPLDEALTVVWTAARTREALVAAMRAGRLYALQPGRDYRLRLDDFSIGQEGSPGTAAMGGELAVSGPAPLRVTARLSATDGRAVPVTLRLVRSGRVVDERTGTTPFETLVRLEPPAPGAREFLRLEVTRPQPLLSSPVFVRRTA